MRSHRSMPLVQAMAERKRELQHQGALLEPRASQMVHRRLQNRSVPDPAGGANEITTTTVLLVMAKVTRMTTTKARSTRIANQLGRRSARRYDGETRVSFVTDRFVVGIMLFLFEKKNILKKGRPLFPRKKKGNRDRGQMTTHKKIELILWIKSGLFFLFFLFIFFFFYFTHRSQVWAETEARTLLQRTHTCNKVLEHEHGSNASSVLRPNPRSIATS